MLRKRSDSSFARDERGAMSVEALFWVTLVAVVTAVFVDSASMFTAQQRILRIMYDANRSYSLGFIATEDLLVEYIEDRLADVSPSTTATAVVSADGNYIMTSVSTPATDYQVFGTIPAFSGLTISLGAVHMIEFKS